MTVQELALRNEIRQIMNEGGINKNTIKDIVKSEIDEIIKAQIRQALTESDHDFDERVQDAIKRITDDEMQINKAIRDAVYDKVRSKFSCMNITVDVRGDSGDISRSGKY